MKHAALVFLAILFATLAAPASAQEDIHSLMGQLDGALQERGALQNEYNGQTEANKVFPSMLNNLKLDQAQYDKAFAAHQTWVAQDDDKNSRHNLAVAHQTELVSAETAKMAAHAQSVAQHNANQCHYPQGNPGACAGYDAEKRQQDQEAAQIQAESASINAASEALNQEKAALDDEAARINADKAQVDQEGQNLNAAIAEYNAKTAEAQTKADRHNQAWTENEAKIARILASLKTVGVQVDDCNTALKDTRDGALEVIHAVCGRMFDGNR